MSNALTNPLAALIASAAKKLPADTGATARVRERQAEGPTLLIDVSLSMREAAYGGRRKIDVLREAVAPHAQNRWIAFSGRAREVRGEIPEPAGGTALAEALVYVRERDPVALLVISDGHPDDPERAISAARRLLCRIDVLYIGPEDDREAMDFMARLAQTGRGCGVRAVHDLSRPQIASLGRAVAGLIEGRR